MYMESNLLARVLKNDYRDDPNENIYGYFLDNELSGKRAKVYVNDQGQAIISHRGTQGIQDVFTDLKLLVGDKNTKRFRHAEKIQKKAEEKYGRENLITTGHSLGGAIAEKVGKRSSKIYTYNKPVVLSDINKRVSKKQTDIKTSNDPFSIFRGKQKGSEPHILKSKTYDPLHEHSTASLRKHGNIIFY